MAKEMAQFAMGFGKSVIAGITGNNKSITKDLGKKILDSNMTKDQALDLVKSGMSRSAFEAFSENYNHALGVAAKKGMNTKEVSSRLIANKLVKNSAGYKMGNAAASGIRGTFRSAKHGNTAKSALQAGFTKKVDGKSQIAYGKVAGAAFGVGVAGRVAGGGGLYRDRYGRVNAPGIPFI